MRWLVLIIFIFNITTAFGGVCVRKVENPGTDPYLNYVLLKKVEEALLETGQRIDCGKGSVPLQVSIKRITDVPLAYSPRQRITSYNLEVVISVSLPGKEREFFWSVPYEQESGLKGEMPRREAFEDALDKLSLELLDFLRESLNP